MKWRNGYAMIIIEGYTTVSFLVGIDLTNTVNY
jgi:hypothetical protein